jgi:hypothetical protein
MSNNSCFNEAQQLGSMEMNQQQHGKHEHNCECEECAAEDTLYPYIDTTKLRCDNESKKGSVIHCFKPWSERHNFTTYLQSGVDPELLLFIPFTVAVKIKSISITGGEDGMCPNKLKIFKNRGDIEFGNVTSVKSEQDFDLVESTKDPVEYNVKAFKFQNVNSLTLYFPSNHGADRTRIYYIGIKGEATNYKKQVVHAVYEAKPMLKDHEVRADKFIPKQLQ